MYIFCVLVPVRKPYPTLPVKGECGRLQQKESPMWWIVLFMVLLAVAVINMLAATVVGGYISDALVFVLFYLKQIAFYLSALLHKAWVLIVKFFATLRWYDVVIIPLILRLRRVVLFDVPYRFVTKYVAPMILLDATNRALIRKRMHLLITFLHTYWQMWFDRCVDRLEPWFGRHARTVVWVLLSGILILGLFALTGLWFIVAWIPAVERWLQQLSVWLVRLVRTLSSKVVHMLFRTSVLLVFAAWWQRLGQKLVPDTTRQQIKRRQHSLARTVIRRRRTVAARLRGLSWWQRFVVMKLGFWEALFEDRLRPKLQVARMRRLEHHLAKCPELTKLRTPVRCECFFCEK